MSKPLDKKRRSRPLKKSTRKSGSRQNNAKHSIDGRAQVTDEQFGNAEFFDNGAGCYEQLVLKRLNRIESNYAEIESILSDLERNLPDLTLDKDSINSDSVDPRKPR